MDNEASVVAKKLENFFEYKNQKINVKDIHSTEAEKHEPGLIRSASIICLMSLAILLTKTTLGLTYLIKKLERR